MTGGQGLVRVVVTSSHRLLQCNHRLRLEDVYPESSLFRQSLLESCLSPAPPSRSKPITNKMCRDTACIH